MGTKAGKKKKRKKEENGDMKEKKWDKRIF